jgi:hypothetical protein
MPSYGFVWRGGSGRWYSHVDGGKGGGKGITDKPGGSKFQWEGHDVRYRDIRIKELDLEDKDTDF